MHCCLQKSAVVVLSRSLFSNVRTAMFRFITLFFHFRPVSGLPRHETPVQPCLFLFFPVPELVKSPRVLVFRTGAHDFPASPAFSPPFPSLLLTALFMPSWLGQALFCPLFFLFTILLKGSLSRPPFFLISKWLGYY